MLAKMPKKMFSGTFIPINLYWSTVGLREPSNQKPNSTILLIRLEYTHLSHLKLGFLWAKHHFVAKTLDFDLIYNTWSKF